jgi:hypothetical protein
MRASSELEDSRPESGCNQSFGIDMMNPKTRTPVGQRIWSETAKDWVAQLQREWTIERGFDPSKFDEDLVISRMSPHELDDFRRKFANAMNLTSTQVDEAMNTIMKGGETYTHLIMREAEAIEEMLPRLDMPLDVEPLFRAIGSGRVNAMAVNVPTTGEYILLFDTGLFTFCNLFAKIASRCIPFQSTANGMNKFSTDPGDVDAAIASNVPEMKKRYVDVLSSYIIGGDPKRADAYLLQQPYMSLADQLRNSMALFVIGHEYAHITRGHLNAKRDSEANLSRPLNDQEQQWMDEIEADTKGFELALNVQIHRDHLDLPLSYWGADFFLSCLVIVERCVSILRTGSLPDPNSEKGSHPPATTRRSMLRMMTLKSLGDSGLYPIEFASILERIVESIWEQTKDYWFHLHQRGVRPSLIDD